MPIKLPITATLEAKSMEKVPKFADNGNFGHFLFGLFADNGNLVL